MNILQDLIDNEELVWEKSLNEKIESLLLKISKQSVNELFEKKDFLNSTEIND